MPKNIVWLASYPKSGNTWLRLFLFNYLFNLDEPAPINQANRIGPSDASVALYRTAATEPSDMHDQLVTLRLRPKVLGTYSAKGADVNFMKTHNANLTLEGVDLIPARLTRCAIYIMRNPLDMALSYAHHFSMTPQRAIDNISRDTTYTVADDVTVHQYLGNWSDHVTGWVNATGFETCPIRYEDMTAAPHETFGKVLRFIGAPLDEARLDKAIRFASFKEAKKQETEHGFVEKPKNSKQFFRSGKVGEGREKLSPELIEKIIADHGTVMRQNGYLG